MQKSVPVGRFSVRAPQLRFQMPPPIPPHIVRLIIFDLEVGYSTVDAGKRWKVTNRAVRKIQANMHTFGTLKPPPMKRLGHPHMLTATMEEVNSHISMKLLANFWNRISKTFSPKGQPYTLMNWHTTCCLTSTFSSVMPQYPRQLIEWISARRQ